ncbi:TPA: hypothetical protein ACXRZU_000623 [Klebsiella pneumoniae]
MKDKPSAYLGISIPNLWKTFRIRVRSFDNHCKQWAMDRGAPVWLARIPLVLAALTAIVGFIIWAGLISFGYVLSNVFLNGLKLLKGGDFKYTADMASSDQSEEYGPVYMNGNQGEGWYTDNTGSVRQDN